MLNILSLLSVGHHAEPLKDPNEINRKYRFWRVSNLTMMILGYAVFYFVRKNFSMAMPHLSTEWGLSNTDFGIVLSLFSIIYGVGKFANGVLADRMNARFFMALGLLCSAIINIFMGFSAGIVTLGIFYLMNAWFQSFGMPASVRLLTHWYSPTELGTMWAIQSTAHQIGGAVIYILCGFLIPQMGWKYAFFVPAFIAVGVSFLLILGLRDTPQSIGLPSVEVYRNETVEEDEDENEDSAKSYKEILLGYVFNNKYVWIVAIANIFVYIVRMGIMDWAPKFLQEARGATALSAGLKVAGFELAGIVGCLGAGFISDKLFKGRRGPLGVIYMVLLTIALIAFWLTPQEWMSVADTLILIVAGAMVYGAQLLIPVAAADFATKKAACAATGLTGASGYIGSTLAGVGLGMIVDQWGWNGGFIFFIASAAIAIFLFALIWNKRSPRLDELHQIK